MVEARSLSLVAQYDDLIRGRSILSSGSESEFLEFVVNQEKNRKRWFEVEKSAEHLKRNVNNLEQENVALQTKLKHARSQIDHEIRKRQKVEQERDAVEQQILLVRELLNDKNNKTVLNEKDREKLAFLGSDFTHHSHCDASPKRALDPISEASASLLSPTDISFDKTEEDLDTSYFRSGRKWKRSTSAQPRSVLDENNEDEVTPPGKRTRRTATGKKKHRRSNSADAAAIVGIVHNENANDRLERQRHFSSPGAKDVGDTALVDSYDVGSNRPTPSVEMVSGVLRRFGSGSTLTKTHVFASQTCIRPLSCLACGKKMRFGKLVYKCKDCRAASHPDCRDLIPLPCIPTAVTPGGTKHVSLTGTVADYAPVDPPMIPALVIHCVKEVEQRGLSEVGIYRVPGNDRDVKELKEKFIRGKCPNLSLVEDIHVVCGCLKDFLRGLKEPLVTYRQWKAFVNAAEKSDRFEGITDTYQAISELPQPNRDTIAYLVLHLQRVAECVECKMPAENLAKVFGPTVVGYSSAELEPMQMFSETTKQHKVIERLLNISSDYWSNFINIDIEMTRDYGTPRLSEVPHSMFGPISMATELETPDRQRWFTPRHSSVSRGGPYPQSVKKTPFFTSPMLK